MLFLSSVEHKISQRKWMGSNIVLDHIDFYFTAKTFKISSHRRKSHTGFLHPSLSSNNFMQVSMQGFTPFRFSRDLLIAVTRISVMSVGEKGIWSVLQHARVYLHRAQVKIVAIHLRSSVQQCLLRENGDTKSFGGKKKKGVLVDQHWSLCFC